jgi:hypothetical protein
MSTPVTLSNGKVVELTSPTLLLDLTPEERKELMEIINRRKCA